MDEDKNANWYKELKDIHNKKIIIAIAVQKNDWDSFRDEGTELFTDFRDAKEMLDYDFDDGYGGTNGPHFTAWTKDRVYFPVEYDGSENIASVPRNPCLKAIKHI